MEHYIHIDIHIIHEINLTFEQWTIQQKSLVCVAMLSFRSESMILFQDSIFKKRKATIYRVSQLKRNTFQWFIVLRLEGKYLCT